MILLIIILENAKEKFKKETRHSFEISIPLENYTTGDFRRIPVFSTSSESIISTSRNMSKRMIDIMSDSSFSLCRCFSKEVFGTEEHHELIRNLLVQDIKCNAGIYMDLMQNELKALKQEKALKDTKTSISSCLNLITDGIEMPSLQLQVAANIFQCSIFVINIIEDDQKLFSVWGEFKPNKPNEYAIQNQAKNVCKKRKHYVALYKTFTEAFHRVVPMWEICNCCLPIPDVSKRDLVVSNVSGKMHVYCSYW